MAQELNIGSTRTGYGYTVRVCDGEAELGRIEVYAPQVRYGGPAPAEVNWQAIGSTSPAVAVAYAKALQLAARLAEELDDQAVRLLLDDDGYAWAIFATGQSYDEPVRYGMFGAPDCGADEWPSADGPWATASEPVAGMSAPVDPAPAWVQAIATRKYTAL